MLFGVMILTMLTTCARPKKTLNWECPSIEGPLLETVTFNAGLAPGVVPYATPRTVRVAEEVGKLRGTGLVCLQEIWTSEAQEHVLRELNLPPENVFTIDTRGDGEQPGVHRCSEKLIKPLLQCVEKKCGDYPDEEKSICAKRKCFMQMVKIYLSDKNCVHCLLSVAGQAVSEVEKVCTSPRGQSRVYGGSNGTILVSRWPLKKREVIRLPSSGVNRVALLATVDVPGMGEIEVGCTHLSSETILKPIYPGFKTWSDEMLVQFNAAEKRMQERSHGKPQIFLGDFNAGPGREGYGMHWPVTHRGVAIRRAVSRVWHHIRRSGFHSAAARAKPTFCTTCSDNKLRGSGSNYLIDHALLRDPKGGLELEAVCAYPWFDSPVRAITSEGETTKVNLSDHYGTVVKYRVKK